MAAGDLYLILPASRFDTLLQRDVVSNCIAVPEGFPIQTVVEPYRLLVNYRSHRLSVHGHTEAARYREAVRQRMGFVTGGVPMSRLGRWIAGGVLAMTLFVSGVATAEPTVSAMVARPCSQWTSGQYVYLHCYYDDGGEVLLVSGPNYMHAYYW